LHLPDAESKAQEHDLELVSCRFDSAPEQLRPPKIVRVGIFQHKLPLPPGVPIKEQRDALYKLAKGAIETAAIGGVNVFCFQEAWSESTLLQNFFVQKTDLQICLSRFARGRNYLGASTPSPPIQDPQRPF
jgi:hypothetical protein